MNTAQSTLAVGWSALIAQAGVRLTLASTSAVFIGIVDQPAPTLDDFELSANRRLLTRITIRNTAAGIGNILYGSTLTEAGGRAHRVVQIERRDLYTVFTCTISE